MAKRGVTARIDLKELEKLCSIQATDEELAAFFGVTTRTIERRRKSPKFAEAMERGKAKGRLSIRRMQLKLLEEGNATMAIWLGKNYLGQRDQFYHEVNGPLLQIVCPAPALTRADERETDVVTIEMGVQEPDFVRALATAEGNEHWDSDAAAEVPE